MPEAIGIGLQVLVVDDEATIRRTLAISLEADGCRVVTVGNVADALTETTRTSFDLAFVDLRLGVDSGMELIEKLRSSSPWMHVVMITAHGSIDAAVEAMKRGAVDFITKPFTPAQVRLVTDREVQLKRLQQRVARLERAVDAADPAALFDSTSPAMRQAIELGRRVASADAIVLLRGESGTGKGVLANASHAWSSRSNRPFATVSAPSLSAQLLESELFGHVKGAFTGAMRDNPGRIAATEGGTLFLDEIGDLPLEIQPKLLRFIQERKYERVGDTITRRADVRLIFATNVDLEKAVKEKRFREDLFYRINVVPIDVPPLRERPGDILTLAEGMLNYFRAGKPIAGFNDAAANALMRYNWPGNVRELKNVVERATILCQSGPIGLEHLPITILSPAPKTGVSLGDLVPFDKIEEAHIRRVIASTKSLEEAAEVLDIDVATLWRKRRKYGI